MGNREKLQILLNLIEKQQKEIEELNEIKESFINQKKIDIEALEKKDNIIDLMTEELNKLKEKLQDETEGEEDCFIPDEYSSIDDCVRQKSCKDCIKQYFIRKVEEKYKKKIQN